MYNDEYEKWWEPFQSLWPQENEEWMAERRRQWKLIRRSVDPDGRANELELRGMRNLFLTGHVFTEKPPWPDLDGVARQMYVGEVERMVLAPFAEEQHYNQFVQAILKQNSNKALIAGIMNPFPAIGRIHKHSGLADEKSRQVYQFVMGGGLFSDNKVLLEHERALKSYSPVTRIESYFFSIAIVLKLKGRERGQGRGRFLELVFDYHTSIAEHICEFEEKYRRSIDIRQTDYQAIFEQFKHRTPIKEPWAKELYEKSCDFLYGDRLPKALRYG